jgi:hypothetical protein
MSHATTSREKPSMTVAMNTNVPAMLMSATSTCQCSCAVSG